MKNTAKEKLMIFDPIADFTYPNAIGCVLGHDERMQLLRLILTEPDPDTYLVKPAYIPKMDEANIAYETAVSALEQAKYSQEAVVAFKLTMDQLMLEWGVPEEWYYKDHPEVIKRFISAISSSFEANTITIVTKYYHSLRIDRNRIRRKGMRGRKRTIYSTTLTRQEFVTYMPSAGSLLQSGPGVKGFVERWMKSRAEQETSQGKDSNDNDAVSKTAEGQEDGRLS